VVSVDKPVVVTAETDSKNAFSKDKPEDIIGKDRMSDVKIKIRAVRTSASLGWIFDGAWSLLRNAPTMVTDETTMI